MKRTLLTLLMLSAAFGQASAQEDVYNRPRQNANGDWLTNGAPRKGQVKESSQMPGSRWRVVSTHLNCRREASLTAAILFRFRRGTVLQADLGRGGADEVYINALDNRGKPWMLVRNRQGSSLGCFVRAHQSFLRPD